MLKMKMRYDSVFNDMVVNDKSNYKYFITGSPTSLNKTRIVEADSFQELWQELLSLGEIDEEAVDRDYGYTDEIECFHWREFDKDYDEMIEEYLSDGNDFYYRKFSWLDEVPLDDWVEKLINKEILTSEKMEDLLNSADIRHWELVGNSGKYPDMNWYSITDINGKEYDVYERVED